MVEKISLTFANKIGNVDVKGPSVKAGRLDGVSHRVQRILSVRKFESGLLARVAETVGDKMIGFESN